MLGRIGAVFCLLGLMAGCTLDTETKLREQLSEILFLDETLHFQSQMSCTVAAFRLERPQISSVVPRALSIDTALTRLRSGSAVVFEFPGDSPNTISEKIMSRDLGEGLGLLSSGVGPLKDCLDDNLSNAFYAVLMSPESKAIYDPEENAFILVYPPENIAIFLRGNV